MTDYINCVCLCEHVSGMEWSVCACTKKHIPEQEFCDRIRTNNDILSMADMPVGTSREPTQLNVDQSLLRINQGQIRRARLFRCK